MCVNFHGNPYNRCQDILSQSQMLCHGGARFVSVGEEIFF